MCRVSYLCWKQPENRYVGPAGAETSGGAADKGKAAYAARGAEIGPALVDDVFTSLLVPTPQPFGWLLPWNEERTGRNLVRRIPAIDAAIAKLNLERTDSVEGAFFDPGADRVNIPPERVFVTFTGATATQGYYATLLHEVAHWTGHRDRLGRHSWKDLMSRERYAREELVAEATAMILMRHFGIEPENPARHRAYFQSWLAQAGDRESALAHARDEAKRATRFILGVTTT